MKNDKHIFAKHISEVGIKNQPLKQDINVINEMADGGNVDGFKIGDKGKYETRSGKIDIVITNITDKGWVIYKDDKGNRKDAKIDVFTKKFTVESNVQPITPKQGIGLDNLQRRFQGSNVKPTTKTEKVEEVKEVILPKPEPEKLDFEKAKENFMNKNIVGEGTIFTEKFVLLESLIELKELSKIKEKELSEELDKVIEYESKNR